MSTDLYHLLLGDVEELADTIARDLKIGVKPHYNEADMALLRVRCLKLVEEFVESLTGRPERFAAYVAKVATERITEGYHLREIQRALSVMHDRLWELAVQRSSIGSLVINLSAISQTVGAAKDELARVYLARKEEAEKILAQSPERTGQLFRGTDANIQP
jgi:hypothetical protein